MKVSRPACRLLYIVGQLGLGGLERQLYYLLQNMDRQRYKPVVAVWNYCKTEPYVEAIQALQVPVLPIGDQVSRMSKLVAFRRMMALYQPEVVHSYCFFTNVAAWWATLGSTALSIGSIRNSFLFSRQISGLTLGRACARWPQVQICNSKAAKTTAEHCTTLFKPSRLFVVRNGLDLSHFSPQPRPRNRTALAIGSLYPRKRWDRLINIVSRLSAKGIRFQVRHAGDGPLRGELEELAKRLGVGDRIHFLGPRNDISELLAGSDLLVHTAEDEGCPNVVMEAMACGRAVVAMDAGDIPTLVEDEETGYVVPRGDVAMFAERVQRLLGDDDLCSRMGLSGRAKAERDFSLQRLRSETLAVYKAAGWKDS